MNGSAVAGVISIMLITHTRLAQSNHSGHCELKDFKGSRGYTEYVHSNHLKVTASSPVIWTAAKRQGDCYNNNRTTSKELPILKAEAVLRTKRQTAFEHKTLICPAEVTQTQLNSGHNHISDVKTLFYRDKQIGSLNRETVSKAQISSEQQI